jgi:hypothetical protein
MRRIAWFPGALALTALAAGCVGQIGDPSGGAANNGLPEDDPGRVTMHRLNKAEYNNTVRDLLGTQLTPADDFPADDISYGSRRRRSMSSSTSDRQSSSSRRR